MPMDQRAWDLAQLEAQLKIQKMFEEWKAGFLGNRAAPLQPNGAALAPSGEQFIPEGGPEEPLPIEEETVGGRY